LAALKGDNPELRPGEVDAGKLLFTSYACAGCHSLDGTRLVGPSLKGIGARADKGFLKQSMLEPNAVIATDFPAAMPSFAGMLSAQQIEDLLAYLQSLR
jgi:cytochrome c oxidase subunit 2